MKEFREPEGKRPVIPLPGGGGAEGTDLRGASRGGEGLLTRLKGSSADQLLEQRLFPVHNVGGVNVGTTTRCGCGRHVGVGFLLEE